MSETLLSRHSVMRQCQLATVRGLGDGIGVMRLESLRGAIRTDI